MCRFKAEHSFLNTVERDFNTSYVSVQAKRFKPNRLFYHYFNTSYVSVQELEQVLEQFLKDYFNTSYVSVQVWVFTLG